MSERWSNEAIIKANRIIERCDTTARLLKIFRPDCDVEAYLVCSGLLRKALAEFDEDLLTRASDQLDLEIEQQGIPDAGPKQMLTKAKADAFVSRMMSKMVTDFKRFMATAACSPAILQSGLNLECAKALHGAGFAAGMKFSQSERKRHA